MEQVEVTTAEGEGVWGNVNYQVSLDARFSTYYDSAKTKNRTVVWYFLSFKSSKCADQRRFESEEARRSFMDKSFSELSLVEIPESERQRRESMPSFRVFVGENVAAVTFVMDYLQLQLSSGTLNFYHWPVVIVREKALRHGDVGYRDALCEFVTKKIRDADELLDEGLKLEFTEGSIAVPLKVGKDFRSPEIAEFVSREKPWLVWQVGEPPFEDG
ncbi:MAG TPA: hypothetical protein VHX49_06315 [Candidatus Acidoferrales bacterium]|nr:hypothetical protein [Candidatus Acidoferrales bacterium]